MCLPSKSYFHFLFEYFLVAMASFVVVKLNLQSLNEGLLPCGKALAVVVGKFVFMVSYLIV